VNSQGRHTPMPPQLTIFLCWMAYTAAYPGRYSYNSNITPIMDAFGVTHGEAGLVTTCFFFAYGIGQVVNGLLCRRYPRRWIIPFSLACSAVLNIAVFLGAPFWTLKYLWLLNGGLQSILWPTLISVLSQSLPASSLKSSVLVMSTTVPIGTLLAYGLSSLLAVRGGFPFSFLTGALLMAGAAAAWLFLYRDAPASENAQPVQTSRTPGKGLLNRAVAVTVLVLCLFAVANNLVKDGLTTWVPSILKERFGLPDSLSILLTLVLPVLGIFGAACNGLLERRLPSFIKLSGLWFLLAAVSTAGVILLLDTSLWWAVLAVFGIISLSMHAVNNAITSMAPLYMREQLDSGLLAGVLNGCCYVGSTISSYGLGWVADHFGWNGVFLLLLAVTGIPVVTAALVGTAGKKTKPQP
jgi:OPA family glycerol-3-phosphate transporter-like MFS transporter